MGSERLGFGTSRASVGLKPTHCFSFVLNIDLLPTDLFAIAIVRRQLEGGMSLAYVVNIAGVAEQVDS